MEGDYQVIQNILKTLVLRILEANSIRELISNEKLKEAKKEIPEIVDMIYSNYILYKDKFEQLGVNPVEIHKLEFLRKHLEQCSISELVHLAEVATFIMENEIFKINKIILDNQS